MKAMDEILLWTTALGSLATALFTAFLWLVAWKTLGGARDQLRLLRQQSEREGRPYVTLDVVPGLHGAGRWDLVVTNTGRTAAKSVTFAFDEWAPKDGSDHITAGLQKYLCATHILVPGARHRLMWRSEDDPKSSMTEAGADASKRLTVNYQDDRGQDYVDDFDFDVGVLGVASPVPTEGPRKQGAGNELANIEKEVRTLNVHVGELRR